MLASSFSDMIFVDADCTFFQPPENLLEWPDYKASGTILFRDRTMFGGMTSTRDFANTVLSHNPSSFAVTTGRIFNLKSVHEGESGIVVLDKSRHFVSLLLIVAMNTGMYKEDMYKYIHGDKESYWLAFEMMNVPYFWAPGGGGTIGYLNSDKKSVCGGLFHVDLNWRPLWVNGGVIANKYSKKGDELLNYTHFAVDRSFDNIHWDWETETTPFCLHTNNESDMLPLSESEKKVTNMIREVWEEMHPK